MLHIYKHILIAEVQQESNAWMGHFFRRLSSLNLVHHIGLMTWGSMYVADDLMLCVFANESSKTETTPCACLQVDLVLPPPAAFIQPDL